MEPEISNGELGGFQRRTWVRNPWSSAGRADAGGQCVQEETRGVHTGQGSCPSRWREASAGVTRQRSMYEEVCGFLFLFCVCGGVWCVYMYVSMCVCVTVCVCVCMSECVCGVCE